MSGLVLCDVDGVVADLHTAWFGQYNDHFGDDLHVGQTLEWDPTRRGLKCSREEFFDILWESDLYERVDPYPGAVEGVQFLRDAGFRVVFVTSSNSMMAGQKMDWLREHGFISGPKWDFRDVVTTSDKSLVGPADIAIEDYHENLRQMRATTKILVDRPYNRGIGVGEFVRLLGWSDIARFVQSNFSRIERGA